MKQKPLLFLSLAMAVMLIVVVSLALRASPPSTSVQPARYDDARTEQEVVARKEHALVAAYPEFNGFADAASFAGQGLRVAADGSDHYFTYIVYGSGLPIAQATCFRVDRAMRVFMVGEFPDPADSYAGYQSVDPRNCAGMR